MQALVSTVVFVTIGIMVFVSNRHPEAGIWFIGAVMFMAGAVWFYVGFKSNEIIEAIDKKVADAIRHYTEEE